MKSEKFISNFIENQFPQFYHDDGENFILFMKAYYEWMESDGQPIKQARTLSSYRDIDDTIEPFLEYFQKKYLYGIPFDIISNKRFLLKHILDVYRSKGTIQCFKLLFKLIYNEDINVYLPGIDIIKSSDGTWKIPLYLEVTDTEKASQFVGKVVVGTSSGVVAVVEELVKENIGRDIINVIYLSNIMPVGADFIVGEKIVLKSEKENYTEVQRSPTILGSLSHLNIVNGGQDFKIGDIIKIAQNDPTTGDILAKGKDGLLRVTALAKSYGQIFFDVVYPGFGYMANADVFIYKNALETGGSGASFDIFSITDTQEIEYNTDIICDYLSLQIGAAAYGLPGNTIGNSVFALANNIIVDTVVYNGTPTGFNNADIITIINPAGINAVCSFTTNTTGGALNITVTNTGVAFANTNQPTILITNATGGTATGNTNTSIFTVYFTQTNGVFSYRTDRFGKIGSLTNVKTGNSYNYAVNVFVRSTQTSKDLIGNVSYSNTSNTITGVGTSFDTIFAPDDVIWLKANNSLVSTIEKQVVKTVTNATSMVLYGPPSFNSTSSAKYRAAPVVLMSQFAPYEPVMTGTVKPSGINEEITGLPSVGDNSVAGTEALDSGRAYTNDELVYAYLYGALTNLTIQNGGVGYSNLDPIIFTSGDVVSPASGYVLTNANGTVTSVVLTSAGSGYTKKPTISVKSANGKFAVLDVETQEFNTVSEVIGRVQKRAIGRSRGSWTTTRGHLNSDKYIQDSYYYQDYSYEIQVPVPFDDYKSVMYNTFHPSGSELFGKFSLKTFESSPVEILEDDDFASTIQVTDSLLNFTCDNEDLLSDTSFYSVDVLDPFTVFANTFGVNSTSDVININNANSFFNVGDYVYYLVPSGNSVIQGTYSNGATITGNAYYYITFSNTSAIAISESANGSNVDITENRTNSPGESHYIYVIQ